ncbi:nuclear transport factor 2 family protein [Cryobacterium adonitolivorans]|uniref:Nuclear transport factor 2 family protein n=1 Tax=Cryobacterium adonitolivorans TaxID=1259189 RepID=A0A4R8WG95_9MICO|nr:nuclear transport factor 2 family protein [Cryobacterium adonitolivorans]TFC06942.1 nuclear transport factor 2 family protein [Cryobacterium adonitolivorans]
MTDDLTTITQVVLHERQARDRGWWYQMAGCFWPDSQVHLSWHTGDGPGFVAASREMAGRGDASVHRMSPPTVHVADDRAWTEVPAGIEVRTRIDGVQVDLVSYARVCYRLVRRDLVWKIASLDVIYERDTATAAVPGESFTIPPGELERFRPSYAILAWHLDRRGYTIGTDLLGDDRPAERDAFYARTLEWLHA